MKSIIFGLVTFFLITNISHAYEVTVEISYGCRNHFCLQAVDQQMPLNFITSSLLGGLGTTLTVVLLKTDTNIAQIEKYEMTGEIDPSLKSLLNEIQSNLQSKYNIVISEEEVLSQLERDLF